MGLYPAAVRRLHEEVQGKILHQKSQVKFHWKMHGKAIGKL